MKPLELNKRCEFNSRNRIFVTIDTILLLYFIVFYLRFISSIAICSAEEARMGETSLYSRPQTRKVRIFFCLFNYSILQFFCLFNSSSVYSYVYIYFNSIYVYIECIYVYLCIYILQFNSSVYSILLLSIPMYIYTSLYFYVLSTVLRKSVFTLYTRSKFKLVEHSTIIRDGKIQHQLLDQEYSFTITQRLPSTTYRKDGAVFTQNALEGPLLSQSRHDLVLQGNLRLQINQEPTSH